jgi:hypothetical protein
VACKLSGSADDGGGGNSGSGGSGGRGDGWTKSGYWAWAGRELGVVGGGQSTKEAQGVKG